MNSAMKHVTQCDNLQAKLLIGFTMYKPKF